MRHTNFRKKSEVFSVINNQDTAIKLYKFTKANGVSTLTEPTITTIGDYYKAEITAESDDCFMLIKWGNITEVVRVGNPDILLMFYAEPNKTYSYKQCDMEGSELDNGTMTEIGYGFYYVVPQSLVKSYYDILDSITTLNVPYTVSHSSGSILLNNNEYMDIAIPVKGKKIKEYLMDWIANETGRPAEDSVKYAKAYVANDASHNKYLSYVPGVTNAANSGNFSLISGDGENMEITGFKIKMKDYKQFHSGDLIFPWNSSDGDD